MFRDRQAALEALEKQLLSEEEDEETEEFEQEEEIPPRRPFDFDTYNTDDSDVDMARYADQVYRPRKKNGCAFWLLLLAAAVLAAAYFLAKREGLL